VRLGCFKYLRQPLSAFRVAFPHPTKRIMSVPQQPDILYHPDRDKWAARTARRLSEDPGLPYKSLPNGFPKKLDSRLVWEGQDWKNEAQWVHTLSAGELKEIDDAVKYFHGMPIFKCYSLSHFKCLIP